MKPSRIFLALALAACGRTSGTGAPQPAAVTPPGAYLDATGSVSTQVTVSGESFVPLLVTQQNSGGGLRADKDFKVTFGDSKASQVTWVDSKTITANVEDLPAGNYTLTVTGPYGSGSMQKPFVVSSQQPAQLLASASAPLRATSSEAFDVSFTVTNSGQSSADGVTALLGATPAAEGKADIAGGSSQVFTWHQPAQAAGELQLSLTATGTDHVDGRALTIGAVASVSVVSPAALTVTAATVQPAGAISAQPSGSISLGQQISFDVTVQNGGASDASGVEVEPDFGDGVLQGSSVAAAQDIPAGESRTFHYQLAGSTSGTVNATAQIKYVDATSGVKLTASAAWGAVAVQVPAALSISLTSTSLPQRAPTGRPVPITLTVRNTGEATAKVVQPVLQAGAAVLTSSDPVGADLAGGALASFHYSFPAAASGAVAFLGSASAIEGNTGDALNTVPPLQVGTVIFETQAALSLSVLSLPPQVSSGETFQVVINATNAGAATAAGVKLQLSQLTGLSITSALQTQDIAGGATVPFTFTLQATAAGAANFTASVAKGTDFDSGQSLLASAISSSIPVQLPAALQISSFTIPATLSTGQTFNALLTVRNSGGAIAQAVNPTAQIFGNATIVTPPGPPGPQDIAGGESATFVWTLQAGSSKGSVSLSVSLVGSDANSSAPLSGSTISNTAKLQLAAQLSATLTIPGSLSRGQSFTATLTVQNTGEATAHAVAPTPDLPVAVEQTGADASSAGGAAQPVDIAGGTSATFSWTFTETGTASGSFKLQAAASGFDVNSGLAVPAAQVTTGAATVQEPAALTIDSLTLAPAASVSRGQGFTATLVVRNTGEAVAAQVAPSPEVPSIAANGGAAALTPDAPAPQDIAGGATASFSWTFAENGTAAGALSLSVGAAGLDQNSGASVSAVAVQSAALTVQQPAALVAVIAPPPRVSRGQAFAVSVSVTNTGDASATAVTPGLQATPGGAAVLSSPAAQDIAGGATATFNYSVHEAGAAEATLSWSATATGSDSNSRAAIASPSAAAATAVDAPAALSVQAFTLPSAITRATSITAQLIVTNTGDAVALHVVPSTPAVQATGGASAFTSTAVSPVDLPGHQTATFSWTFTEDGTAPGTLGLSSTISAADANSAASISATATASPVPVQAPSLLNVVSYSIPAKLSRGQTFTASLVVQNTGGTAITGVDVPTPSVQATGGAGVALVSAPLDITLPAHSSPTTLSWTYTENGASPGTLQFAAVVTGTDAILHAAVSTNASSSAAAVQQPAALTLTLLSLPSRVARGQQFNAQLTVQNAGGATAAAVTPAALALAFTGGAHASINAAPAAQDIAGGASATFSWTLTEDGSASGSLSATASVSATDANSGSVLTQASLSAGPVTVEQPAALSLVSLTSPTAITRGQSFTVSLLVNNSGEAGARVTPGTLAIAPAGAATIVSTPSAADITGGSGAAFSWTIASVAGNSAASVAFSISVTARDRDSNALLSAGPAAASTAVDTAPLLVIQSFALRSASNGGAINRGETFTADLTVVNNGQATANAVLPSPAAPALSATGGAVASTTSTQSAVALAGGQSTTFHWSYTESGSAAGTLALSAGLTFVDANSGASGSATTLSSNTLLVQNPSALTSTLSVPASIGLGTTFSIGLAVQNSGDATARSVTPSLTVGGTSTVVNLTSPAAADIAGGATANFQWTYTAAANGSLSLSTSASGTDANDGAVRTTSATGSASVTDAALIASDPFSDGSPFAYVFEYSSRVFVGPRSNGVGAISMQPDGSGGQSESFLFNAAASDLNTSGGPFPSLGYSGCTANTPQCGPDNENGRADFYAGILNGTEFLVAAGTRQTGSLKHIYATSQTTSSKAFTSVALDANATDANTRGVTSMLAVGSRFYVGFAEVGAGTSGASGVNLAYLDTGFTANPGFTNLALDEDQLDGIGTSNNAHVQLVDSMIEFNGLLYLANNGGCERSTVAEPQPWNPGLLNLGILTGPEDWASCTPSSSQWSAKKSVTTTKTTDFTPADRAVPQMAVFQGRLYLARNTTTGPQLWVCSPGSNSACDANEWTLVAPNSTGDTLLSTFNDTTVTAISLLAATSQHLYVGYDGSPGVSIFRSNTATPVNRADFVGQSGCPAANHPASCAGLNGSGLGNGATRLWSDAVMTFGGTDFLYLAAGDGSSGASIFRVAQ